MYKKAQICNLIILNLSELCLTILSAVWAINKLVQSQVSNFGSQGSKCLRKVRFPVFGIRELNKKS